MEFAFLQAATDAANQTTYTFASQNLGTADSDRYIIVAAHGRLTTGNISTITVGGVSATIVAQSNNTANIVGIAVAAVPTGTTGDVVVTFSTGMNRAAIELWRAVGINSATPSDTDTSTASPPSVALDVPAGGFAVAAFSATNSSATTWTGLTERSDASVEFLHYSSASDEFVSQQTGLTITATAASALEPCAAFASWAPAAASGQPTMRRFGGIDNANFRCGSEGVKMWRVQPRPSGLLIPDRSLVIPQPEMRIAN